jgi:excisionase family DNA binding protein
LDRLLLRPLEAAQMMGIGRSKVYELLARGEIPSVRIDGVIRIPLDKLKEWIEGKGPAKEL